MLNLYMDVETTGLDCKMHDIVQVSAIIDNDGVILEEYSSYVKPYNMDTVDDKALEVNGLTREQLATFPDPKTVAGQLIGMFKRYASPKSRETKLTLVGFNVEFDWGFMQEFFARAGYTKLFLFINNYRVDLYAVINWLRICGKFVLPNHQLQTVCSSMAIPLRAHDALEDIRATRKVDIYLRKHFLLPYIHTLPILE